MPSNVKGLSSSQICSSPPPKKKSPTRKLWLATFLALARTLPLKCCWNFTAACHSFGDRFQLSIVVVIACKGTFFHAPRRRRKRPAFCGNVNVDHDRLYHLSYFWRYFWLAVWLNHCLQSLCGRFSQVCRSKNYISHISDWSSPGLFVPSATGAMRIKQERITLRG